MTAFDEANIEALALRKSASKQSGLRFENVEPEGWIGFCAAAGKHLITSKLRKSAGVSKTYP